MSRIRKALRNPWFIIELVYEWVFTRLWTVFFMVACAIKGVKTGRSLHVYGRCIVRRGLDSEITIGEGVQIISSSWRSSTANCMPSKLRTFYSTAKIIMGRNSGMTGGVIVARSKTIRIGERCMLAPNVTIFDSDFHIMWPPDRRHNTWETDIDRDVTLEENVWVGTGSIILKGVTIGKNSVIAAGSVVTTDIPENCLAGGNPARVIRDLSVN